MNGKNIMVTGAAGFIGSHLTERLAAEDIGKLIALDNLYLGKLGNLDGARKVRPDIVEYLSPEFSTADYDVMEKVFSKEKVDVVFDLATLPLPASLSKPYWCFNQIAQMASTLCELCRLGAFPTLIHCSTSEVYGTAHYVPMDEKHPWDSRTAYAAAKGAADLCVKSYVTTFGIDAVIVRPFNTYGPRQNDDNYAGIIPIYCGHLLDGTRPVVFGNGEQSRDFTHVTDTAAGFLAVAQADYGKGEVINVAAGHELSVNELGRMLFEMGGSRFEPEYGPERPGDVRRHAADITRYRELTGCAATVDMETGLKETIEWYRAKRGA